MDQIRNELTTSLPPAAQNSVLQNPDETLSNGTYKKGTYAARRAVLAGAGLAVIPACATYIALNVEQCPGRHPGALW
jgi:DNA-binding transcriptional LysR family regulator